MAILAAPVIVATKPEWVPVVLSATALILSLINIYDLRKYIEFSSLRIAFITRIPGTFVGAALLSQLSLSSLQLLVAATVLLAVILSLIGKQFHYTPTRLAMASFVSGITGTSTSIGGPPMALVMQHGDPKHIRANLALYFGYSCIISLISYALIDRLSLTLIWVSLSFAPVCIAGFILGKRWRGQLDAKRFRPALLFICGVAGLFTLVRALPI